VTDISAGWHALSQGKWAAALDQFAGAENDPEALEGVGVAQWWLDDADATLAVRERAYELYLGRGDPVGAARMASALAWDSLLFGGQAAVARGWLDRAAHLLADVPPCPEHAWLAVREAEVALSAGDAVDARVAAQRAIAIAAELGCDDIQVVGRSLEGFALVYVGAVADGMRRLDESASAATAGDVDDLMWVGKVCCNLIAACERVGDVERATEWCDEVKEFAQRWELRTLFNVCRTQYAAVLLQQGTWNEAERELTAALDVLGHGRRASFVEGTARLGELRRRQGRVDEARVLFAKAELHPIAKAGAVEIALDEGDAGTALSLAERLERATDPHRRLSRITVLLLVARAGVAAGRRDVARVAAAELAESAEVVDTSGARAAFAWAGGVVAGADGRHDTAIQLLEQAVDLYGAAQAPYERAKARLALAGALADAGLEERARAEETLGTAALAELVGAPRLV
jgi:tetratricopeptide (TPR) repeat protein